jgi:hypothetical protein
MMSPLADGHTHINIYSKGRTELGKLLSNFSRTTFHHNWYGTFNSVEAFWHWRKLYGSEAPDDELDQLKLLEGHDALRVGRLLRGKYQAHPKAEETFQEDVLNVITAKILGKRKLKRLLRLSTLPFQHYYWYGNIHSAKVTNGHCEWMVAHIESIRAGLKL